MKKIIKFSIFICLFLVIFGNVIQILWIEKKPIKEFYAEPKNSLDLMYIGGSNVFAHFNASLAFHLYGYTTGMMSSAGQPFMLTKNIIKETEKYQNPKLYIIDLYQLPSDLGFYYKEINIRDVVDNMKFSQNRTDAIKNFFKYVDLEKSDLATKSKNNIQNYKYSFLLYHNSWKDLNKNKFVMETYYKGYLCDESTIQKSAQKKFVWNKDLNQVGEYIGLPKTIKKILEDLVDYIEKEKLNVLFVIPARVYSKGRVVGLNNTIEILENMGFSVLNFNTMDDFSINYKTEMFNGGHLNTYGATKYTLYFAKYLKEHYKLKDHRKDKKYQSWEKEYQRFKNDFKELTNKSFDDVLEHYQETL